MNWEHLYLANTGTIVYHDGSLMNRNVREKFTSIKDAEMYLQEQDIRATIVGWLSNHPEKE